MLHQLKCSVFAASIMCMSVTVPVSYGYGQNLDIQILEKVHRPNSESRFWQGISNTVYSSPAALTIGTIGYGLASDKHHIRHRGYENLMSMALANGLAHGTKAVLNRPRPEVKYPDIIQVETRTVGSSFPSGHTAQAFATATTFTLQYPEWYMAIPAYLWAGTVGYSRMYLGKHYPTDVLGGIIIGVGTGFLAHWLMDSIDPEGRQKDWEPHGETGHTTASFAFASTVSLQSKAWEVTLPSMLWATSVGYIQAAHENQKAGHVLGAAGMGLASGALSHWLSTKLLH